MFTGAVLEGYSGLYSRYALLRATQNNVWRLTPAVHTIPWAHTEAPQTVVRPNSSATAAPEEESSSTTLRAPRTAMATLISVGFMAVAVGMSAFPPTTRFSYPHTCGHESATELRVMGYSSAGSSV